MACSKDGEKKFEGGYELKAVDEDKDLECSICLQLLRDAMGTPCSHVLCRGCIQKLVGQEDIGGIRFNCPECQQPVDTDKVYPNAFLDRKVRGSNVYCLQKGEGCEWMGTLASFFQQHRSECNFQIVLCQYEGCIFSGIKVKIKDHESNCEHRMVQCEHCQTGIKVILLGEHYASCERISTSCPQSDCDALVPKIEIPKHLDQDCMFVIVSCSYAKFGCLEKVLRKDHDGHNKTATNRHMAFMCDQLLQCGTKNQDLQNEIDKLKLANSEIPKMKSEIEQLNATNKEIPKLKNEIKKLKEELNRDLLLRGVERWVKKNDNITMVGSYTEWCKKIFIKMEENRLYQFDSSLLVKLKNKETTNFFWSSNGKEEQDEACIKKDIYYRGDNRYILRNAIGQLVIETETLDSFNSNNSEMFVLHPSDSTKIISGIKFKQKSYNGWQIIRKLYDDFYVDGFAIVCLIKM